MSEICATHIHCTALIFTCLHHSGMAMIITVSPQMTTATRMNFKPVWFWLKFDKNNGYYTSMEARTARSV